MRLGRHLRELWENKLGVAIAIVVALLAAGRTYTGASFPQRSPETARAATHVLVDTPRSSVVDLRQDTYDLEGLTNRALLVSNAMASLPVRERIAARAGVPSEEILMNTPLDVQYPQEDAGSQGAGELASSLKYRLDIQANVTVPIIDIDTEAPTEADATKLANAAADGLKAYLNAVAADDATPVKAKVGLVQLGRAQAVPVRSGAGLLISLFVFWIVLALASATVLFLTRIRRGWSAANSKIDSAPTGGATWP